MTGGETPARAARSQLSPSVGQLFGSRAPDPDQAVASRTPLVLTGVIADDDPHRGFGILGTAKEHTALYRVGASLPGAARLVAVYADRVELERAGSREVLRLPRGTLVAHAVRVALASREPAEVPEPPTGPEAMQNPKIAPPLADAAQQWIHRYLRWEERDSSGRVIGVQLARRRREGIEAGDILTAINGVAVTRDNAARLLDQESAGPLLALTVLRNGKSIVVNTPAP